MMNYRQNLLQLRNSWLVLLALTLLTSTFAESMAITGAIALLVCATISLKASQIIDNLMGLRHANPLIRGLVYCYFLLIPLMIGATVFYTKLING
ncbi:MAG: hypothetical protein M0Q95_03330 [Porticoccaceae bacterium]|jgi:hypothetical protein|nr:hypothetical protein [Porticoccaceae bacterium]